jgi:xanthine/uracil permease
VAVTGIKSRFVVATGGLFLVILGLLPFMGRVIAAVPTSVLGGAGIVLFGTVAASGIRTLSKVDYRNNVNLIIVATSIGFGMIPIAAPNFYDHFPSWFATIFHSGISSSAIMRHRAEPDVQPPPATRPAVGVCRRDRAGAALSGPGGVARRGLLQRRQAA